MAKKNKNLIVPLRELVNMETNLYELTNAAIHRASQISIAGSDNLEKNRGKIASTALEEIVFKEVEYSYKE